MPGTVTIISVVLNAAQAFEFTARSVLSQDYSSIEWIVVDGGSTDATPDAIGKYKSRISCLISEPDKGIFDAMNKGLAKATGEWVNFMNAGDAFGLYRSVAVSVPSRASAG